jgi:HEAT repeat protein
MKPNCPGLESGFMRGHLLLVLTVMMTVGTVALAEQKAPSPLPRLQGLIAAMGDRNDEVVLSALSQLRELRTDPQVLRLLEQSPHWGRYLKSPNVEVRRAAAKTLVAMGPAAAPHAQHLMPLLKDESLGVRDEAFSALSALKSLTPEQVEYLVKLLEDTDENVRALAVETLASPGPAAIPYVKHLLPLLKDKHLAVRASAIKALTSIGPLPPEHLPFLLPLLEDESGPDRVEAIRLLAQTGPAASPYLLPLLKDKEEFIRTVAISALGKLGPSNAQYLLPFLKDESVSVRYVTVGALSGLGPAAAQHAKHLLPLLRDPSDEVRGVTATALATMGSSAAQHVPYLQALLRDSHPMVRASATKALFSITPPTTPQLQRLLLPLLGDAAWQVRAAAAKALSQLGPAAAPHAPRLLPLLKDESWSVREQALHALGAMGPAAAPHLKHLQAALDDSDEDVRATAAEALVAVDPSGASYLPHLLPLLNDDYPVVQQRTRRALGKLAPSAIQHLQPLLKHWRWDMRMGALMAVKTLVPTASERVPYLLLMLKDNFASLREDAAKELGAMGPAAAEHAAHLLPLLKDEEPQVRVAAAQALSFISPSSAPFLVPLLEDKHEKARIGAAQALSFMGPVDLQIFAAILSKTHDEPSARARWLLAAHTAGGGTPAFERSLRWLGRPPDERPTSLTPDEARVTLQAFAELWPHTERHQRLRADLASQIATVAHLARGAWTETDTPLLQSLEQNLRGAYLKDAETLRNTIPSPNEPLSRFVWILPAHLGFWFLLIFFYPRSPQVQALFFWNPWVRKLTGFGYVGLLLTLVPFLRRRLLAPFGSRLVAEADLERLSAEMYFNRVEVLAASSGQRQLLREALPRLRGRVVLEGASGLGKSMFVRHLLRNSRRPAVFLLAEHCKNGVIHAIQAKLEGHARDTRFLESIIYSGALDIYIDGLNEVTADTRARIIDFIDRNSHANILVTTQRIEWTPPAEARLYTLLPLNDALVEEFLVSREPVLEPHAQVQDEGYRAACARFVRHALSPRQPRELLQATREVLSNPMDLTVVAQMLAQGHTPDLFHLRQQQYELMAADYRAMHLAEFPLKEFSEAAYKMRLEDRATIHEEAFLRELPRLEAFKMVVRRQWRGADGKEQPEWRFRHDKIQEFFIAQTFLGDGNTRPSQHLGDPRLRGVYFLLVFFLDAEKAQALQDLLVEYAAQTRDHTVSDDFVNLLKSRKSAEKARAEAPPPALTVVA